MAPTNPAIRKMIHCANGCGTGGGGEGRRKGVCGEIRGREKEKGSAEEKNIKR